MRGGLNYICIGK